MGQCRSVNRLSEHLQTPMAEVRTALTIDGMHSDIAANCRDKIQMNATLRDAGLPDAQQQKISSAEDANAFIDTVGYPIVMKPLAGVGSKNTVRVDSESSLFDALNILCPSKDNPIQAEAFDKGKNIL